MAGTFVTQPLALSPKAAAVSSSSGTELAYGWYSFSCADRIEPKCCTEPVGLKAGHYLEKQLLNPENSAPVSDSDMASNSRAHLPESSNTLAKPDEED
ncbi:MAG: hypothetical protein AAFY57_06460 [Cyanobacteria bacterium J06642_2]